MCFCRRALVLMPSSALPSLSGHAGGGLVLLQQQEGADQVWGAVEVVVDMTGEWAIKPRGCRFMGHLLLPAGHRSGIGDFVHLNIIRRLKVNLDPPLNAPVRLLTIELFSFRTGENRHLALNNHHYISGSLSGATRSTSQGSTLAKPQR